MNGLKFIKEVRSASDIRIGDRFFHIRNNPPTWQDWSGYEFPHPDYPFGYRIIHITKNRRELFIESNDGEGRWIDAKYLPYNFRMISRKFKVPTDNLSKEIREINQLGYKYEIEGER